MRSQPSQLIQSNQTANAPALCTQVALWASCGGKGSRAGANATDGVSAAHCDAPARCLAVRSQTLCS